MMDVTKLIATVSARPEVKKAVRSMRESGVSPAVLALGLLPKVGAAMIPGVFAAGAVFGAAAALVMTPRTREALRKDVREMVEQLRAQQREAEANAS